MKKTTKNKELPNFLECDSIAEANAVDLSEYRLLRYDEKHRLFIFCRRASRLGL